MTVNVPLSGKFRCMLLVLFLLVTFNDNLVSAQSPSFVRQEIIDGEDDAYFLSSNNTFLEIESNHGKLFYAEQASNESECELENFTLPEIKSVSFVSDGAMLNSTFWLNQTFLEPPNNDHQDSAFVNDSMVHQEQLSVDVYPADNKIVEQVTDDMVKKINETEIVADINFGITNIAGIRATNTTITSIYNDTLPAFFGKSPTKLRDIIIVYNNTVYELTYLAEIEQFDKGMPNFQKMVSSLHINNITDSDSKYNNSSRIDNGNYSTYINAPYGITLQYPSDWQTAEKYFSNDNVVTFFSPIQGPYLDFMQYLVKVFVVPVYQSPKSIEGYLQTIQWDGKNQTWIESLSDRSSNLADVGQQRIIYEKPIEGFFEENDGWVKVPLELHNLNSPSEYQAIFSEEFGFVKDGHYCDLFDPTNVISAPPPKFSITSNPPGPVSIGPYEEKVVEIKIQSSTDLVSNASLSVENMGENIQDAYFRSDEIQIPPSGWAIAQLVIKGSSSYSQPTQPRTLDIVATIEAGSPFLYSSGNGTYAQNADPNPIEERSAITLNELSLSDYLLSGFSALNTSGAVTLTIAIGTAIAGLVGGLFGGKRLSRKKGNDAKTDGGQQGSS
jgi:hypothetical protein